MKSSGPLRVAFAGTPEFAAVTLRCLIEAGFEIPLVLTQPDRPAGRGMKLQLSPVKQLAQACGLPIVQPRSLKLDGQFADEAAAARVALEAARPDVVIVAAYGLILPRWMLALPRLGCVNIHASLLPRWRGAAPIQRAIEAGDAATGITIMQMDEGLDTGDILLAEALPIAPDDSSATLHDKLAAQGGRLVVQALQACASGALEPRRQSDKGVTYAAKVEKAQGSIDWRDSASAIERRLRAFDPKPGCHFDFEGAPLKLWRGKSGAGFDAVPGSMRIAGDRVFVACGDGALELLEVQRPGGRRLPAAAWLASRPVG